MSIMELMVMKGNRWDSAVLFLLGTLGGSAGLLLMHQGSGLQALSRDEHLVREHQGWKITARRGYTRRDVNSCFIQAPTSQFSESSDISTYLLSLESHRC